MQLNVNRHANLFIATPCYGGQLHAAYVNSLISTIKQVNGWGLQCEHHFIADSLVNRVRNVLVARFMASRCTHFLFIDGDIEWEPEAVMRLLAASEVEDIEICCGIYPKKVLPPSFPVNFSPSASSLINQHPRTGFIEIKDAPTGFLMVRRTAFERMMAAYPERKCFMREDAVGIEKGYEYALFDCFIDEDGCYLSEDYGFSRLWQRIGGQVWMDPQIHLAHFGQYKFEGNVSRLFVPNDNSSRPTAALDIEGWMTPEELAWLGQTARQMKDVVEVGAWKGRGTFTLCSACPGSVFAVDHWQGSDDERSGTRMEAQLGDVHSQFLRNVGQFKNLTVVKRPSLAAVLDAPIVDMVFLDAARTHQDVVKDLKAWRPKTRRLLCGYGYHLPGVKQAVDEVLGRPDGVVGSIWFVATESRIGSRPG